MSRDIIRDSQNNLKSGDDLTLLDITTLKYVRKPLGKAIYRANVGRPRKEEHAQSTDRIKCNICGKIFTRSARANHNKTKYHQTYASVGEKMRKVLIDN